MSFRLCIENAHLVQVCGGGKLFVKGKSMNESVVVKNNMSVVVGLDGMIVDIGLSDVISEKYQRKDFLEVLDCKGKSILPGFVDSHTHPVWSGDRVHEFEMKLGGKSYMEIHKAGGGIGFTVKHTRKSNEEELQILLNLRLDQMSRNGTTLVEGKSGYGLDLENEMKILRVLHEVAKVRKDIDLVSTYLGAHSIPKEKSKQEYVDEILKEHLPLIKKLKDEDKINPDFVDIFIEKNVFEEKESMEIFKAASEIGLIPNFHGDELSNSNSGKIASLVKSSGVSHLEHVDERSIELLSKNNIVGVLLPTTAYILRIEYPPARKMIDSDVIIAIATDFNPNAHCMSMPFVMNLSCVNMKMTLNEALVASTINAAYSLRRSEKYGSIEIGKFADMVVVNNSDWRHIIYEICNPPIYRVIKKGIILR